MRIVLCILTQISSVCGLLYESPEHLNFEQTGGLIRLYLKNGLTNSTKIFSGDTSLQFLLTIKISSKTKLIVNGICMSQKSQKIGFFSDSAPRKTWISQERYNIFSNGLRRNASNTCPYHIYKNEPDRRSSIEQLLYESVAAYAERLICIITFFFLLLRHATVKINRVNDE